jgi:hypothetical protein
MTQEEAIQKLNITVDLIPSGNSNRPGTRISPTHITVHNTANAAAGADAAMHARYVKGPDARARKVSWHFTVDDRRVFKHLPTNEKGWHAGGGNSRSIGIEVCENKGIDKAAVADRAALLTALMMLAYGIPREKIVPHKFWTGKDCPRVLLRQAGGFDAFRDRAAHYLEELSTPAPGGLESTSSLEAAGEDAYAGEEQLLGAELLEYADMDDAGLESAPADGDDDGGDRVAELERMVGRLAMENFALRRALEGGGPTGAMGEPEAA